MQYDNEKKSMNENEKNKTFLIFNMEEQVNETTQKCLFIEIKFGPNII